MDTKNLLSSRIRHLRKDVLRKTQDEFAFDIGIDPSHLSRIECGTKGIGIDKLVLICELYGLPINELVQTEVNTEPLRAKLIEELIEIVEGMDVLEISVMMKMIRAR